MTIGKNAYEKKPQQPQKQGSSSDHPQLRNALLRNELRQGHEGPGTLHPHGGLQENWRPLRRLALLHVAGYDRCDIQVEQTTSDFIRGRA